MNLWPSHAQLCLSHALNSMWLDLHSLTRGCVKCVPLLKNWKPAREQKIQNAEILRLKVMSSGHAFCYTHSSRLCLCLYTHHIITSQQEDVVLHSSLWYAFPFNDRANFRVLITLVVYVVFVVDSILDYRSLASCLLVSNQSDSKVGQCVFRN